MASPRPRVTLCPLCDRPLSAEEIASSPPGEYPAHYRCRLRHQRQWERLDDEEQEREYRGREEG